MRLKYLEKTGFCELAQCGQSDYRGRMLTGKCNPIKAFTIKRHIGFRSSIEQRITISVRYHGANHLLVRGAPEHVRGNTFFRKHRQEIISTDGKV